MGRSYRVQRRIEQTGQCPVSDIVDLYQSGFPTKGTARIIALRAPTRSLREAVLNNISIQDVSFRRRRDVGYGRGLRPCL